MDGTINHRVQNKSLSLSIQAFRLLVVVVWTQYTILEFVAEIVERLPIIGVLGEYMVTTMVVILALFSLPWFIKRLRAVDIVFYLVCAAVVLGTMLLVYENSSYIEEDAWTILGLVVPLFFIGVSYSHETSKKDLFWASLFGVVAVFAYQMYSLSLGRELEIDNMNTAYNVLPSVLYLIYWALEHKKLKFWLVGVSALLLMFVFGTRGPVLAALVFLLLGIFFNVLNQKSPLVRGFYLVIFAAVIAMVGSKDFLVNAAEFLSEKFKDIGFSTRIFDHFIEGEIAQNSGRDVLYRQIAEAIKERPILGYGLMGDRPILGFYVHNLFLELWCHFGVILGSFIILAMICIPLAALMKTRKTDCFNFVLMLTCMVFAKLMFTGSYVVEPYLYFLMGVSISLLRNKSQITKC